MPNIHELYASVRELYLETLMRTLSGILLDDPGFYNVIEPTDPQPMGVRRYLGLDWPLRAQTMIGLERLRNIKDCISAIVQDGVEGDCIETGVWRGGACIFMRANLAAHGDMTRKVWVCDSFEGLPPPDAGKYPADEGGIYHKIKYLAVSLEEVQANFKKYGMLDDRVVFLKGFFKDSLPNANIDKLALVRLDGDMYESTIQSIEVLYPKLSPGGFLIVDDYSLPSCRKAIDDYRNQFSIDEPVQDIDGNSAFWRKKF